MLSANDIELQQQLARSNSEHRDILHSFLRWTYTIDRRKGPAVGWLTYPQLYLGVMSNVI